eukprot:265384-Chlamydomonas_euryale.AAC.1
MAIRARMDNPGDRKAQRPERDRTGWGRRPGWKEGKKSRGTEKEKPETGKERRTESGKNQGKGEETEQRIIAGKIPWTVL